MSYVKFMDNGRIFEAKVIPIDSSIVKVVFDSGEVYENSSGFLFSNTETFKTVLGRYEKYNTIYETEDNELYLSCDGSVYPEESDKSDPSLKERVILLESENKNLKQQLESAQNQLTDAQLALCDVFEMIVG
ncbi:MAG: hypothetical protein ACERKZ_02485 [Lachnotalea sp.]